jgi:drug/metabolite transporter (DMT)-like permease
MSSAASRLFGRPADRELALGFALGTMGMIAFSFRLPATKLAVRSTDAVLVGLGRALLALPLAAIALWLLGAGLPPRSHLGRLGLVMLGVVFGFPLFTALALHHVSSAHGAVVVGLLSITTAAVAVIRGGGRPSAPSGALHSPAH